MKRASKRILGLCLALVMILALSACGSGRQNEADANTLRVFVCADHADEEKGGDAVAERLKELLGDETEVEVFCLASSYDEPGAQSGSGMKIMVSIVSAEVDVILADEANATHDSLVESFYPLTDLLTEDEIAKVGDRALSYMLMDVDDRGNPVEEPLAACGIDITGTGLADGAVASDREMGFFVVANAPNKAASKRLMEAVVQILP